MYIGLETLDGTMLHGAREIEMALKSGSLVTVERTEEKWVYFKEVDPKNVNKNKKYYRLSVSSECTDSIHGAEFGAYLNEIEKIVVDGMVAWDAHSEVSSTGTKYYAYVTEVAYAEVSVKYNKKLLFGVHAPIVSTAKRNRNKGNVDLFRKGWFDVQRIQKIDSEFASDVEDAKTFGAKLKYKVYAPALVTAK